MHRRRRRAGAGIGIFQPVILRLLELLLGQIQGQPIVVGFEIPQCDGDVFSAHPQKSADIDDNRGDLSVAVENQVRDMADLAVLNVIDAAADHFAGPKLVRVNAVKKVNFASSSEEMMQRAAEARKTGNHDGLVDPADTIPENAEGNNAKVEVKAGEQTHNFALKAPAKGKKPS